jgi:uncharacterized protein (DUF2147 family)
MRLSALVLMALALAACTPHAGSGPIAGQWLTASGNFVVRIDQCGATLCGAVSRVLGNQSMAHPGAAMTGRPARVGLKILTDLAPDGDGRWKGRLYNRENGKTYDCQVSIDAEGRLVVRGYVGLPLLGKTQLWRRVP